MATATRNPPVPQPPTYTLTLTEDEASDLAALVMWHVTGDREASARASTNAIGYALEAAGAFADSDRYSGQTKAIVRQG